MERKRRLILFFLGLAVLLLKIGLAADFIGIVAASIVTAAD